MALQIRKRTFLIGTATLANTDVEKYRKKLPVQYVDEMKALFQTIAAGHNLKIIQMEAGKDRII
jgi:hypothetical protein